jgi:hypothetical protein
MWLPDLSHSARACLHCPPRLRAWCQALSWRLPCLLCAPTWQLPPRPSTHCLSPCQPGCRWVCGVCQVMILIMGYFLLSSRGQSKKQEDTIRTAARCTMVSHGVQC